MGVFDDVKLEQLDWMTQMTETIDSDLNELLAQLPDRTQISYKDIMDVCSSSYINLNVSSIVQNFLAEKRKFLPWEEKNILVNCFEFEIEGELEINLETDTLSGKIFLVKKKATLSDEDLQPLMGRAGLELLSRRNLREDASIERMNEIMDILGGCSKENFKGKSKRNKLIAIKGRLSDIFKKNEWRIRDMNLANKTCEWIFSYINTGNLASLTNLCKLKVMTHNNMPIYSVKEEV